MAFWVIVALAVALFALRRALTAEKALVDQRRELLELRRMVQTLADRLGERWPGVPGDTADSGAAVRSAMPGAAAAAMTAASASAASARRRPRPPTRSPSRSHRRWSLSRLPTRLTRQVTHCLTRRRPGCRQLLRSLRSRRSRERLPSPSPRQWPAAARSITDADSLESAIGGRWLLYIGIAAIVLGASYFLKYAFDNEWINEHTRVIFGVAGGVALTLLGRRFVQRGHELYGQVLCGGGLGIVYLSIYAAHAWYGDSADRSRSPR